MNYYINDKLIEDGVCKNETIDINSTSYISCIELDEFDTTLYLGSSNGLIFIFKIYDNYKLNLFKVINNHYSQLIRCINYNSNLNIVLFSSLDLISYYKYPSYQIIRNIDINNYFNKNSKYLNTNTYNIDKVLNKESILKKHKKELIQTSIICTSPVACSISITSFDKLLVISVNGSFIKCIKPKLNNLLDLKVVTDAYFNDSIIVSSFLSNQLLIYSTPFLEHSRTIMLDNNDMFNINSLNFPKYFEISTDKKSIFIWM